MESGNDIEAPAGHWLWHNKPVLAVLIATTIGITVAIPNGGVLGAFAIALLAALFGVWRGSFPDLGFRRPDSWAKTLGTTLAYGAVLQLVAATVIDPGLGELTGRPVDLSDFDAVRGNLVPFVILLAVGWGVGGFLEEITFRGFVVGRVNWMSGDNRALTWLAVVVSATAFGIAHMYQGLSGMLSTGLAGFLFGVVYVLHDRNLWYPIFTHGFTNTIGITFIYLDVDRVLNELLF